MRRASARRRRLIRECLAQRCGTRRQRHRRSSPSSAAPRCAPRTDGRRSEASTRRSSASTRPTLGFRGRSAARPLRVRRHDPAEAPDDLAEQLEEQSAIVIVENDVVLPVAARGDVVDRPGKLDSHRSCHAPRIPRFLAISGESAEAVTQPARNLLGMEILSHRIYEE